MSLRHPSAWPSALAWASRVSRAPPQCCWASATCPIQAPVTLWERAATIAVLGWLAKEEGPVLDGVIPFTRAIDFSQRPPRAATGAWGGPSRLSWLERVGQGDLGSRCSAWDDGRQPDACLEARQVAWQVACLERPRGPRARQGQRLVQAVVAPPPEADWWLQGVAAPRCYVDPRKCDLEAFDPMESRVPRPSVSGGAEHVELPAHGTLSESWRKLAGSALEVKCS